MTTSAATPNANTFSLNSVTPSADESPSGGWLITVTGKLLSYPNVTDVSTSFKVIIDNCLLTAFNAPTLTA